MRNLFLLYAFINKPILPINKKININYKIEKEQLNIINNNLEDKYSIVPDDNNEYILTLNIYTNKSYLSILVMDKYINNKGEYILEHIEPIKYNDTYQYYYMYSNISLICLYFNYNDNKLINIDNNIHFIYDNTTKTIIYNKKIKPINKYILKYIHLTNLKYLHHYYYSAKNIIYSIDD